MVKRKLSLKEVCAHAQSYVKTLQNEGLSIERVFLFGSYAKGHSHKWSDIDVCVISPHFGKRCDPYEYFWTKRRGDDVIRGIAPVGFNPKDFVDEDPLAWEIKRTGIEIWPNERKQSATRIKTKMRK